MTRDNRSLVNTGQQDTGAGLATSWLDYVCLFKAEFLSPIGTYSQLLTKNRGGAANFGFISITYHQYIIGLYKYILRLEISIFDRENTKNHPKFRIFMCFWDIQSGRGTTTNVGFQEIFSLSNILISPNDILIIPYDLLK